MSKLLPATLLFAAGVLLFSLSADDSPSGTAVPKPIAPATPLPAAPPEDPFSRGAFQANGDVQQSVTAKPSLENLLSTLETWTLSQADFVALLDGPTDGKIQYARLEELAKTGKAKLLGLIALGTQSGQRGTIEAINEVRYATEFKKAERVGEIPFPTAFDTRNTGNTLELEAVLRVGGKIDINLVPNTCRFAGFRDWQAEENSGPVAQPNFDTERVTTIITVQSGSPAFLSTATPANQKGYDVRVQVLRVTAQPVKMPPALAEVPSQIRIELHLFTLDREAARRILSASDETETSSFATVRNLVTKGEAELETVCAFVVKSGRRGVVEGTNEYRYPNTMSGSAYAPPPVSSDLRQPASIDAFDTRNNGVTLEIEPTLSSDGRTVDINVAPNVVRLIAMPQTDSVAAKYPPQPLFSYRRIITRVTSGAGIPVLLGTMSNASDNGVHPDDGRTCLAYIRATPVNP